MPPDPGLARAGGRATAVGPSSSSRTTPAPPSSSGVHLAAAGLRPVTVRTGEEGLAAIRALRPTRRRPGHPPAGHGRLGRAQRDQGGPADRGHPGRRRVGAARARPWLRARSRRTTSSSPCRRRACSGRCGARSPNGSTADGERRDVVVIDDDPTALELVRATLEPRGWTVTTCTGGAEALSVIRAVHPSVVLVDLLMPRRRRLRRHRRAARGPAHGRDPRRRAHGEVPDGAGPPAAAGPDRVRGVEGRARPQLARRPADARSRPAGAPERRGRERAVGAAGRGQPPQPQAGP